MNGSEMLACIDALALEVGSKIADYTRLQTEIENLRAHIAPPENVSRHFDTREFVSQRLTRRRTA